MMNNMKMSKWKRKSTTDGSLRKRLLNGKRNTMKTKKRGSSKKSNFMIRSGWLMTLKSHLLGLTGYPSGMFDLIGKLDWSSRIRSGTDQEPSTNYPASKDGLSSKTSSSNFSENVGCFLCISCDQPYNIRSSWSKIAHELRMVWGSSRRRILYGIPKEV